MDWVQRQGCRLEAGGEPFVVDGCNTYYLMVYAADPSLRPHVDAVLDRAVEMELNTIRTWAFCDGPDEWNALQPAPGVHDENVLKGLDYVLREARRRELRLILPFVNYWPDYGGMDQYVAWSDSARRRDDFYDDPECRRLYRHHVRTILERENTFTGIPYRDDPTILAWELANEPRCPDDPGGWRLATWIEEMTEWIASLDDRHLISVGMEGFFGPWNEHPNPPRWLDGQGMDFAWHHEPRHVDLATFHLYPDHWWMHEADGAHWIRRHVRVAREVLNKPVLLEEFGKRGPQHVRERCFRAWYDEIEQWTRPDQPVVGGLFWALYHEGYPDYDGFGVY